MRSAGRFAPGRISSMPVPCWQEMLGGMSAWRTLAHLTLRLIDLGVSETSPAAFH